MISAINFAYGDESESIKEKIGFNGRDFNLNRNEFNELLKNLINNGKELFVEKGVLLKVVLDLEIIGQKYFETDGEHDRLNLPLLSIENSFYYFFTLINYHIGIIYFHIGPDIDFFRAITQAVPTGSTHIRLSFFNTEFLLFLILRRAFNGFFKHVHI